MTRSREFDRLEEKYAGNGERCNGECETERCRLVRDVEFFRRRGLLLRDGDRRRRDIERRRDTERFLDPERRLWGYLGDGDLELNDLERRRRGGGSDGDLVRDVLRPYLSLKTLDGRSAMTWRTSYR